MPGCICAIRKSELAIEQAHRRVGRKSSERQTKTKPTTLEFAKYVIVFTTQVTAPAREALEWYRLRRRIELVFKSLKAPARLCHLSKHDRRSSPAWHYGELRVALLRRKLIRVGPDVAPWDELVLRLAATEPLA